MSQLLNVPLLWDVTLFRLGECLATLRKIVVPLFQGQTFQEGGKTIVLNVSRYSSKHTASNHRTCKSSGFILGFALTPAMFFCVNDCQYCLKPLTY
jgi:hypothetical protein